MKGRSAPDPRGDMRRRYEADPEVHIWGTGGWRACDTAADWFGANVIGVTCRDCLEAADALAEHEANR